MEEWFQRGNILAALKGRVQGGLGFFNMPGRNDIPYFENHSAYIDTKIKGVGAYTRSLQSLFPI